MISVFRCELCQEFVFSLPFYHLHFFLYIKLVSSVTNKLKVLILLDIFKDFFIGICGMSRLSQLRRRT